LRIYDEETKQLKMRLGGDGSDKPGHSSRLVNNNQTTI
jgi:hypothetical protein